MILSTHSTHTGDNYTDASPTHKLLCHITIGVNIWMYSIIRRHWKYDAHTKLFLSIRLSLNNLAAALKLTHYTDRDKWIF